GDLVLAKACLLGDTDVVRELVLAAADLRDAEERDLAQAGREGEAAGEERRCHAQPAAEELRGVGHDLEDVENADFRQVLREAFVQLAEFFGVGFVDEGDYGHREMGNEKGEMRRPRRVASSARRGCPARPTSASGRAERGGVFGVASFETRLW